MSTRRVDARGVIDLLERFREPGPVGLAFDADGTLWSGDVGEDVFLYATSHELLRPDSEDALGSVASAHGLETRGTPSRIAANIFEAYLRGQVSELLTCEVMTWAYAGFTVAEVTELAGLAFRARELAGRVRRALDPVFEWAAEQAVRTVVVSASPHAVVTAAIGHTGLVLDGVGAAQPAIVDGRIRPEMAAPLPYGAVKTTVGATLLGEALWLGSFGDNAFDVDMLRAARVGVAVSPKPALAELLGSLRNTVVLE